MFGHCFDVVSSFAIERAGSFTLLVFRCHVVVSVLCLFLTLPWVGLQCMSVTFPGQFHLLFSTGPRSAVGNVSGNRCESDCISRGREFDPGPVPYFRRD